MSHIYKFSVRVPQDQDTSLSQLRRQLNLGDLEKWRDYYIESPRQLLPDEIESLRSSLGNGLTEHAETGQPLVSARQVQVTYKRGIVDNENDSILELCQLLGIPATAGKVATTFQS